MDTLVGILIDWMEFMEGKASFVEIGRECLLQFCLKKELCVRYMV